MNDCDFCCDETIQEEPCKDKTDIIVEMLSKLIQRIDNQNIAPQDFEEYRVWLNRQKELLIIQERYYPGFSNLIITANSIALSRLAKITTPPKLLGRGTAGSGNVEEITLGSGLTMTGTTLSASGSTGGLDINVDQTSNAAYTPVWSVTSNRMNGNHTMRNDDVANAIEWRYVATDSFGNTFTGPNGNFLTSLTYVTHNLNTFSTAAGIFPPYNSLSFEIRDAIAGFTAACRFRGRLNGG